MENINEIISTYDVSPDDITGIQSMSKAFLYSTDLTEVAETTQGDETSKLFFANLLLSKNLKKLADENSQLKEQISSLETRLDAQDADSRHFNKKKRLRRRKEEVKRTYNCKVPNCDKSYGFFKKF